jgi:CheY-like chemotaxis protein
MSADLLRALSELAWPVIAALVLWRLYPLLREILRSRAFTVKVAGMEISAQQASEQLQSQIDDLRTKLSDVRQALDKRELPSPMPLTHSRRVLWTDDIPSNNAYAIAQLRERGYDVLQAVSTSDAMRVLGSASPPIAAVISDMGREEVGTYKPEAGLELLRAMRKAGCSQPFIVCTTPGAAQQYNGAVQAAGGSGATTSFVELFEFVRAATAAA